jgi:hypothetical protein
MKIKIIEVNTKRPLANTKIQLQVKGKDSGFLSLTTDAAGLLVLEDKYLGQQITTSIGGGQMQWLTAAEGITLSAPAKQGTPTTSSHGDK